MALPDLAAVGDGAHWRCEIRGSSYLGIVVHGSSRCVLCSRFVEGSCCRTHPPIRQVPRLSKPPVPSVEVLPMIGHRACLFHSSAVHSCFPQATRQLWERNGKNHPTTGHSFRPSSESKTHLALEQAATSVTRCHRRAGRGDVDRRWSPNTLRLLQLCGASSVPKLNLVNPPETWRVAFCGFAAISTSQVVSVRNKPRPGELAQIRTGPEWWIRGVILFVKAKNTKTTVQEGEKSCQMRASR